MTTVTVYIKEEDLINFYQVLEYDFISNDEDSNIRIFKAFPFTIYRRITGETITTVNIPLDNYILFLGSGLVK